MCVFSEPWVLFVVTTVFGEDIVFRAFTCQTAHPSAGLMSAKSCVFGAVIFLRVVFLVRRRGGGDRF